MASGAPAAAGRERRQCRHAELPPARSGAAEVRPRDAARRPSVALDRTEAGHIAASDATSSRFAAARLGGYEVRPTGNAVNLEDEMIKVAANQMDYQAATTLYTRSLGLIKTAARQALKREGGRRHGFPQVDRDRRVRPARAGRPHARHRREHRQRRFDGADGRRRSVSPQDPDLHAPRSIARSMRRVVDARPRAAPTSPTSASSTSPAIRPPTRTAMSNIRTSIRWSK